MAHSCVIENGKIVSITIDGKPAMKSRMNALAKAEALPYFELFRTDHTATNPFSGVAVSLNPLEMSIYAFCVRWYGLYERGGTVAAGAPSQVYDGMKYLLMDLNVNAYFDLID